MHRILHSGANDNINFLIWTDIQSNTIHGSYNQFCFGDAPIGPLERLYPILGAVHSRVP